MLRRLLLRLLTLTALAAAAALVAAGPAAAASSHASRVAPRSVGSILRADGSLRTGKGVSGSYSAHGYRLVLGANGKPRFVQRSTATATASAASANPADANWDDRFGLPGVQNGISGVGVNAIAVDGTDVYVGGVYTFGGRARHAYISRWDGRTWNDLSGGIAGANPEIDALALSGNTLYVGGKFATVKNGGTAITVNNVAAWNTQTQTWSGLGTGVVAGSCSFCFVRVEALAVSGSTLYAGGSFGKAGGVKASSIAAWNGSSWSALGRGVYTCPGCPDIPGEVHALLLNGTTLYAGGSFDNAGNATVNNIARWNTATSAWSAMGSGITNSFFSAYVYALAMNGGNLVVGGDFTNAGAAAVNSLAVWTGSVWQTLDGGGSGVRYSGSEGTVDSLLVQSGTLYVGGLFDHLLPGNKATQGGLATFNLTTPAWTVRPIAQPPSTVNAFAVNPSGGVYVGGSFDTGGPLATALMVNNIGILNGSTWTTLGQGVTYGENGEGFGYVLAHAPATTTGKTAEYIGGWFDQEGSVVENGIARWNGTTWQKLGKSGISGGASATGPTVSAIAVVGSRVFIGGDFDHVGGVAANDIAVWTGSAWSAVGGGTDGPVQSFGVSNGLLYAGGSFSHAGGQDVGAPVARWNLSSALTSTAGWSALGPIFGAGGVTAIAFDGPYVFLGGDLSDCVGGSPCNPNGTPPNTPPACETQSGYDINGLIMWDTRTPGSWYYPFGCGVTVGSGASAGPGDVTSLLLVGKTLYAGGYFDQAGISGDSANQVAAMNIASLNLTNLNMTAAWGALGAGVGNDANGDSVASLSSLGHTLYVGGSFAKAGTVAANGVAKWNTSAHSWTPLGTGLACPDGNCAAGVYANGVDAAPDGVYVTGEFGTAGGKGSDNIARWAAPAASNVLANPGFEASAANNEPDSWTPATTSATRSTAYVHSGTYSMQLQASGTSTYTIGQQVAGISAAKPYVVSAWVKIPQTADAFTLTMDVQWLNGTGTVLRTDTVRSYSGPVGGWDEPYAVRTPPAGTTSAKVRFTVSNTSGSGANLYVDDAVLGPAP